MYRVFALILILLGLTTGVAAGLAVKFVIGTGGQAVSGDAKPKELEQKEEDHSGQSLGKQDYVKLNNQFIIPLLEDKSVSGLVAMSIGLELEPGYKETVYSLEPKLRAAFLQILFDHANVGGFNGQFTDSLNLDILRNNMFFAAKKILGDKVYDVLITDIARQDN